jgi:catechol 2,3-dioxygenase-like lactoylglutathione lyase family enzyme
MTIDLFAGIPVRDYTAAVAWYERLLGAVPSFLPDDTEAVWELADHRYVYIDVRPENAGHAMHTLFISDFDAGISQIAERGLEPAERETYANGVRKATFRDSDGNEIGFDAPARPRRTAASVLAGQTLTEADRSWARGQNEGSVSTYGVAVSSLKS